MPDMREPDAKEVLQWIYIAAILFVIGYSVWHELLADGAVLP